MAVKRSPSAADNFTLIKGITRSIESRLHEEGIFTYAKLAALTPQSLAAVLGDLNGVTVKRIIKEGWTGQARDLSSRHTDAAAEKETALPKTNLSTKSRRLTSFVVELLVGERGQAKRTKVLHVDSGSEETWEDWQGQRLLDFFIAHAELSPPAAEIAIPAATQAATGFDTGMPAAAVAADAARSAPARPAYTIDIATSADRPVLGKSVTPPATAGVASGSLPADHSFDVHLALDCAQIEMAKIRSLRYKASIYAKSLPGRLHQAVGEADGQLGPADASTIVVKGSPLSRGLYRLQAVVGLTDPSSPARHPPVSILQTGERLLHVA